MKFLFVVGLEKCGTTSLQDVFQRHPRLNCTRKKESFHFSHHFDRGTASFLELFETHPAEHDGWSVDNTPHYIRSPEALDRIANFDADTKILICLRCPARRAWSHYIHDLSRHLSAGEGSNNFLEPTTANYWTFLEESISQFDNYYFPSYTRFVQRVFDRFGRAACHVILIEEMVDNWQETADRLSNFLDPQMSSLSSIRLHRKNAAFSIPYFYGHWKDSEGAFTLAKKCGTSRVYLPSQTQEQVNNALRLQNSFTLNLSLKDSERVCHHCADDVASLSELLKVDLSAWLQPQPLHAEFSPVILADRLALIGHKLLSVFGHSQTSS